MTEEIEGLGRTARPDKLKMVGLGPSKQIGFFDGQLRNTTGFENSSGISLCERIWPITITVLAIDRSKNAARTY
jgi:hypothetical protein